MLIVQDESEWEFVDFQSNDDHKPIKSHWNLLRITRFLAT